MQAFARLSRSAVVPRPVAAAGAEELGMDKMRAAADLHHDRIPNVSKSGLLQRVR